MNFIYTVFFNEEDKKRRENIVQYVIAPTSYEKTQNMRELKQTNSFLFDPQVLSR